MEFVVDGLPPMKKEGISLRNPENPKYSAFVLLREAASKAMQCRAWYFGGVSLNIEINYEQENMLAATLNEYVGGIMDSLDGSSGVHFTYLPIFYEDDCQVFDCESKFVKSNGNFYRVRVCFG